MIIKTFALALFLAGLSLGQELSAQHNSRNSLDWNGIYSGILPCADCEGIKTDIELRSDGTYRMARKYLGRGDSLFTETGTFLWDEEGREIALLKDTHSANRERYKVGENQLIRLDMHGQPIESDLGEMYVLWKAGMGPFVTNRFWQLIELLGNRIADESMQVPVPHFILWSGSGNVSGNAGCNAFFGSFAIDTGALKIRFSKVASTRMVCPGMDVEEQFLEVIEVADNYTLRGDTLSLNRARMAPLARFTASYFE